MHLRFNIHIYIMRIKRIIAAILATISIATIVPDSAFAMDHKGEKSVGIRGGYTSKNRSATAGLYFQYSFNKSFRISPNLDYTFRHNGIDAYSINLNCHMPIALRSERIRAYPLAGLNYTSWNQINNADSYSSIDDSSTRTSRLGANMGAGIEYYATSTMKLALEAKYLLAKNYSSAIISLSIGYVF